MRETPTWSARSPGLVRQRCSMVISHPCGAVMHVSASPKLHRPPKRLRAGCGQCLLKLAPPGITREPHYGEQDVHLKGPETINCWSELGDLMIAGVIRAR